jgi:hypothetical protein
MEAASENGNGERDRSADNAHRVSDPGVPGAMNTKTFPTSLYTVPSDFLI